MFSQLEPCLLWQFWASCVISPTFRASFPPNEWISCFRNYIICNYVWLRFGGSDVALTTSQEIFAFADNSFPQDGIDCLVGIDTTASVAVRGDLVKIHNWNYRTAFQKECEKAISEKDKSIFWDMCLIHPSLLHEHQSLHHEHVDLYSNYWQ